MALALPVCALMFVALALVLLLNRPETKHLSGVDEYVRPERERMRPLSRAEKNTLVAFFVTVAIVAGADSSSYETASSRMDEGVVAVMGAPLLFILPVDWGSREFTLTWGDAAKFDWGTIVLFGTASSSERCWIPGDGIGHEVTGLELGYETFDWSCRRYVGAGAMMPDDAIDSLRPFDAVLLGAVGWPGVPDHVSSWGLLIPIRRAFRQFANVRPARRLAGVDSPVRGADRMDLVVVRENVEGEYGEIGGRLNRGFPDEMAVQEAVFIRAGVTRIVRYAFELARQRQGRLASATKSKGIVHTMPFWDEVVREGAAHFPDVDWDQMHIDALAARLVLDPAGQHPSMFEPVHGSAPDIAGQGVAHPVAAVWSAAMMLDQLGHAEAAAHVIRAVEASLADPDTRTRDLSGTASTEEAGAAIVRLVGEV